MSEESLSQRIQLLMRLRSRGITDTAVLSAMENTPRELFIANPFDGHAYDDTALPIACGQTISQPTIVAWMTWVLGLNNRLRVLEIGTGSGYQAAILSRLARLVYTVERHKELLEEAEKRFAELKLTNIITRHGDGSKGWKEAAPFDRIMVTAAASEIPGSLLEQLAPGGIMVVPVGAESSDQMLLQLHKDQEGKVHTKHLMPVRFVPLVGE